MQPFTPEYMIVWSFHFTKTPIYSTVPKVSPILKFPSIFHIKRLIFKNYSNFISGPILMKFSLNITK